MPTVFYVKEETYVADRIFEDINRPPVMEFQGAFFYKGTRNPVDKREDLVWLPEPHRTRALSWFDSDRPVESTPEVMNVETEEHKPEKKHVNLCGICGAGPFDSEVASAKGFFGRRITPYQHHMNSHKE